MTVGKADSQRAVAHPPSGVGLLAGRALNLDAVDAGIIYLPPASPVLEQNRMRRQDAQEAQDGPREVSPVLDQVCGQKEGGGPLAVVGDESALERGDFLHARVVFLLFDIMVLASPPMRGEAPSVLIPHQQPPVRREAFVAHPFRRNGRGRGASIEKQSFLDESARNRGELQKGENPAPKELGGLQGGVAYPCVLHEDTGAQKLGADLVRRRQWLVAWRMSSMGLSMNARQKSTSYHGSSSSIMSAGFVPVRRSAMRPASCIVLP